MINEDLNQEITTRSGVKLLRTTDQYQMPGETELQKGHRYYVNEVEVKFFKYRLSPAGVEKLKIIWN